ncbi:MAG TPA: hypothetical protein VNO21_17715, partial [Polyangiaceae bacterium]|nr:hypothetical protein [Polyangiaceae bacterium]
MKALLAFGALTAVSFGSWALDQDVFAASPHTDAAAAHKSAPAAQATKATNRHGKTAMRASVSASIHS